MLCLFRGVFQKRQHGLQRVEGSDRRGLNSYAATWPDRP